MIFFKKLRWANLLSTGNIFTEILLDKSRSTLIVGENGAGKTTLLDALSYVLYGKPFRDINLAQLVNSITNKGMLVEVEFEIGSHKYLVRRGLKPRIFEIYKNDKLVDNESKDWDQQEYLEKEVLKISYKSFKQVIVLGSTNYTPFMQLKSAERRVVIEDLLDIQIFSLMNSLLKQRSETARDTLRTIDSDLNVAKSNYQIHLDHLQTMSANKDELQKQLVDRREVAASKIKQYLKSNDSLLNDISNLERSTDDLDQMNKRAKDLVSLERSLEDKLAVFKKDVHFFEQHEHCPTCNQDIDEQFRHMTIEQYNSKVAELVRALDDVENRYRTVSTRLTDINGVLKQINELNAQIASNNTAISHLNSVLGELQQDIEHLHARKNDRQIKSEIKSLEKQIKQLDKDKQSLMETRELYDIAGVFLKDTGIKTKIIRRYIPIINKLINKYLASMNFYINFELNENFVETIKSTYRDEYSYHSFSEGEKVRINLAILFTWRAIAKLRNSMSTNILIMDEVFDSSLDAVGVDDFLKIIEDLGGETNLFVISHKTSLYDKFHSSINFEKVKNFSRISSPVVKPEDVK